jgi:hypothetical protein
MFNEMKGGKHLTHKDEVHWKTSPNSILPLSIENFQLSPFNIWNSILKAWRKLKHGLIRKRP